MARLGLLVPTQARRVAVQGGRTAGQHVVVEAPLVPFDRQHIVRAGRPDAGGVSFWQLRASAVTTASSRPSNRSSAGMVVISLDFSATGSWPRTSRRSLAQAVTSPSAPPAGRRIRGAAGDLAVEGHDAVGDGQAERAHLAQ